jgi:Zn-dependent protease with chaperone function
VILNEVYRDDRLNLVDAEFTKLSKDQRQTKPLSEIAELVKEIFNMECAVELPRNPNKFFGMQVHPSQEEVMGVALAVARGENGERFKHCTGVVIVIDEQLFHHDFTPREMTAMLLHEVGHKLRYKEEVNLTMGEMSAQLAALGFGVGLLALAPGVAGVLVTAAGVMLTTSFVSALKGTAVESAADDVAIRYGYGEEIHSALTKTAALPSRAGDDAEAKRKVDWSLGAVPQFHARRAYIVASLTKERMGAKTDWEKELLDKQIAIVKRSYVEV